MISKFLFYVALLQLITISQGKNINVDLSVHVDIPTPEHAVEKGKDGAVNIDPSTETRNTDDKVPPSSNNKATAADPIQLDANSGNGAVDATDEEANEGGNATGKGLPSAFDNVDPEFTKQVVELKRQALRIMKLRGKHANPDVKLPSDTNWGDIHIDQFLYESMKKGFDEEEKLLTSKNETDRMAAPNFNVIPYSKWTMPIKYTTTLIVDKNKVALIEKALEEIHTKSGCIKFQKVDSATGPRIIYREVADLPSSVCAESPLGMQSDVNIININYNCNNFGTYMHETLHSLGFHHTQTRRDVDQYVKIDFNNIIEDAKFNFKPWPYALSSQGPYDFGSIMHYSAYAFPINSEFPTLVPKVDTKGAIMGQRTRLSTEDVRMLKKIYCEDPEPNKNVACADKTTTCADLEQRGFCARTSNFYDYMRNNCPFACKFCMKRSGR